MLFLTEEELVQSIFSQTERSAAVIGQLDIENDSGSASVIISSLLNIFDSALVVIALESGAERDECYRNARRIVQELSAVKQDSKRFIAQIEAFRRKMYEEPYGERLSPEEQLDFLNAYDCFMFDFFRSSSSVIKMRENSSIGKDFVSFRNLFEKQLKKKTIPEKQSVSSMDIAELLQKNNELLEMILSENKNINKRLNELSEKMDELLSEQHKY